MSTQEPLQEFFAQFASLGFGYRPSKTAHSNFARLYKVTGWDDDSEDGTYARKRFDAALVQQFHFVFGTGTDLQSWQKFCEFIEITPIPDTVMGCRSVLSETYINIVDLLECARTGKKVHRFATLDKLRKHTLRTKKIFPKKDAQGLLRVLLREIFSSHASGGKRSRKRRRKANQAAAAQAETS